MSFMAHQQLLAPRQDAKRVQQIPVGPQKVLTHNVGFQQTHQGTHSSHFAQQVVNLQELCM
jgi:hypothetical protein